MPRPLIFAAALAAAVPSAAQATPVRHGSPTTGEALRGGGVWIGAAVFLAAVVAVVLAYDSSSDAPASP